jgi:hypothetical protein
LVPEASFDPPNGLSFGSTTLLSQTAFQVVKITNSGGAALTLTSINIAGANPGDFIRTGGTCTATVSANGGNCTVEIAFKPTTGGVRQANLRFTGNVANLAVELTGTGIEPAVPPVVGGTTPPVANAPVSGGAANGAASSSLVLTLDKSLVNFGKVKRNAKKDLKLTVRNVGKAAVKPTFSINGKGFKKASTNCGTLAVNRTCNIVVRFKAPGKKVAANGTLGVMADGMSNPVMANLTATTK